MCSPQSVQEPKGEFITYEEAVSFMDIHVEGFHPGIVLPLLP
jgi:hypothetical protein